MRPLPTAGRLLGAAIFCVAVQQVGVAMALARWPLLGVRLGGAGSWVETAPMLAGSIGLLVAAWHVGALSAWMTRGWLATLMGMPFLLALGSVASGFAQMGLDRPYLPSRALVESLLGLSYRLQTPSAHLALVLVGPLLLLCAWGRWVRRGWFALAGSGLVALVVAGAGIRGLHARAAKDLLVGGLPELAAQVPSAGLGWVMAGVGLLALVLWSAPPDTPRVGRFVWLCAGLLLVEPVPVALGWYLPQEAVVRPEALAVFSGPEVARGGALVDLTAGDVRLDGVVVSREGLASGLTALGHPRLRRGFLPLSRSVAQPWGSRLRAAVRLALPEAATVGDVSGVLELLPLHGISEVHWLGRARSEVRGPLQRAYQRPAFTVLLDISAGRGREIASPWVWLDSDKARIHDPAGRCWGTYAGDDWLSALDAALVPCRDGVVLLPAEALGVGALTAVLDRLVGPGRGTLSRYRVAVVPPGQGHEVLLRLESEP